MEEESYYDSMELARNAALDFMETHGGGPIGAHYDVVIGRLGHGEGNEVGVESNLGTHRRIRLDWDPTKGCHYNVEVGKGSGRKKHAFRFPGSEAWLRRIMETRGPR
ncbi:MAG TPA: hypothetical protein ENK57_10585 [Polyangiaceae bacterium]|nr:hypothetical protein [Polyangiaceae bacterium]